MTKEKSDFRDEDYAIENSIEMEARKSDAIAKIRTVFAVRKRSIAAYAKKCIGSDWCEALGDAYLYSVGALINGSDEDSVCLVFRGLRDSCIRRSCGSQRPEHYSLPENLSSRHVEIENIDELFEFGAKVYDALQCLTPLQNMVYDIYLKFMDEIPRSKGKFEKLADLVSEYKLIYGFERYIPKNEVARIWRSAHRKMRPVLQSAQQKVTNVYKEHL